MSSLARRLVWMCVLLGLAASLTSLYVHYQLLIHPDYTSFCDINATVSCTDAYLSRYGSIAGVPVALLGVVFFAFVAVVAALEPRASRALQEAWPTYLFAAAAVGLAAILYLAYAAFFVLKAVCLLCLATYAAVIGLLVVSRLAMTLRVARLPARLLADLRDVLARPAAVAALVAWGIAAGGAVAFFAAHGTWATAAASTETDQAAAGEGSEFERAWASLPRTSLPVAAGEAAVVIVKFTDYQCPTCGLTFLADRPVLSKYEGQYPGKVKFVAMDFPLQPECNPAVRRPVHLAACDAAVAVRLARERGKGDALEEYFYTHQQMLTPASVREYARTVGGVEDLDGQYRRVIQDVAVDVELARRLRVNSTPTFFINGVRVDSGLPPASLDTAIAYELKKAGVM